MRKDGDSTHRILELVKTKDNKTLCYVDNDGKRDYYRIYEFIENAVTYDYSTDPNIVYNTGAAFGNFQVCGFFHWQLQVLRSSLLPF